MGAECTLHQPLLADTEKVQNPSYTVNIFMANLRSRAITAVLVGAFQEYYAVRAKLEGPQDQCLIDAAYAHHPYEE